MKTLGLIDVNDIFLIENSEVVSTNYHFIIEKVDELHR